MPSIFDNSPLLPIILLLTLGILDYPLTVISRRMYYKYMFRFIEFESISSRKGRYSVWFGVGGKLLLILFIYIIWLIRQQSGSASVTALYQWLLGFTIGTYMVINLRHLESFMLTRLYSDTDCVSGKLSYRSSASMKISAVHFFTFFVIFLVLLAIKPDLFILGLACAALFLALRNLLLS